MRTATKWAVLGVAMTVVGGGVVAASAAEPGRRAPVRVVAGPVPKDPCALVRGAVGEALGVVDGEPHTMTTGGDHLLMTASCALRAPGEGRTAGNAASVDIVRHGAARPGTPDGAALADYDKRRARLGAAKHATATADGGFAREAQAAYAVADATGPGLSTATVIARADDAVIEVTVTARGSTNDALELAGSLTKRALEAL